MVTRREAIKSAIAAWLAWFGVRQDQDDRLGGVVVPKEFEDDLLNAPVLHDDFISASNPLYSFRDDFDTGFSIWESHDGNHLVTVTKGGKIIASHPVQVNPKA